MYRPLFLVLFALILATSASAEDEASSVVVLTQKDFDQTNTGTWMVDFYAPWCGHCKRLAPIWEEYAKTVAGKYKVAKVDCTVETEIGNSQGIRGYPTIKLFHNGEVFPYQSERSIDAFSKFVAEKTGLAAEPAEKPEISSEDDVTVLTDATFDEKISKGLWLVEFYAPWCGHCKRLAPIWTELGAVAKKDGSFKVGKVDCTVEKDLPLKHSIRGFPTIILFKDGSKVEEYEGERSLNEFTQFVSKHSGVENKKEEPVVTKEGEVVVLTQANFDELTANGEWLVKFYAPWCGHCKHLAPIWDNLATVVGDKFNVAKIDCTQERDLCGKYGIRGYPTVKLLRKGAVFDYNGQRTVSEFQKFVEDYQAAFAADEKHDEL